MEFFGVGAKKESKFFWTEKGISTFSSEIKWGGGAGKGHRLWKEARELGQKRASVVASYHWRRGL